MVKVTLTHIVIVSFTLIILLCLVREQYVENFETATGTDVSEGASKYFDWGYHPISEEKHKKHKKHHDKPIPHHPHHPRHHKHHPVPECKEHHKKRHHHCRDADITKNKEIDLYVLKSSVPPCPDMSNYAKKSEIPPNIDLNRYILKSEIPHCHRPNLKNYIKKSEIPACPEIPTCPKCPICPVCPEYSREKYISREHVRKNYVKKSEVEQYCKRIAKRVVRRRLGKEERANQYQTQEESNNSSINTPSPSSGSCPNYSKYAVAKKTPKPFNPGLLARI